eukprot:COSAG04_NODE_96_length_26486_cov_136.642817_7_plen_269_part_00
MKPWVRVSRRQYAVRFEGICLRPLQRTLGLRQSQSQSHSQSQSLEGCKQNMVVLFTACPCRALLSPAPHATSALQCLGRDPPREFILSQTTSRVKLRSALASFGRCTQRIAKRWPTSSNALAALTSSISSSSSDGSKSSSLSESDSKPVDSRLLSPPHATPSTSVQGHAQLKAVFIDRIGHQSRQSFEAGSRAHLPLRKSTAYASSESDLSACVSRRLWRWWLPDTVGRESVDGPPLLRPLLRVLHDPHTLLLLRSLPRRPGHHIRTS